MHSHLTRSEVHFVDTHTPAEAGAEEESHPHSNTRWIAQLRLLYGSRTQRDFLEHIAASVAPHIVLHTHAHTEPAQPARVLASFAK